MSDDPTPKEDVCPKCGAEEDFRKDERASVEWECGSAIFDDEFDQGLKCRIAELEQQLAASREEISCLLGICDHLRRKVDKRTSEIFENEEEAVESCENLGELLAASREEGRRLQLRLEFFSKHYHCRECKVRGTPELHDAICSEDGDSYSDYPTRHDWYSDREGQMCNKMLAVQHENKRLQELLRQSKNPERDGSVGNLSRMWTDAEINAALKQEPSAPTDGGDG